MRRVLLQEWREPDPHGLRDPGDPYAWIENPPVALVFDVPTDSLACLYQNGSAYRFPRGGRGHEILVHFQDLAPVSARLLSAPGVEGIVRVLPGTILVHEKRRPRAKAAGVWSVGHAVEAPYRKAPLACVDAGGATLALAYGETASASPTLAWQELRREGRVGFLPLRLPDEPQALVALRGEGGPVLLAMDSGQLLRSDGPGRELQEVGEARGDPLRELHPLPDGRRVLTIDRAGELGVVDLRTGEVRALLESLEGGAVYGVAAHPSAEAAVLADAAGGLHALALDLPAARPVALGVAHEGALLDLAFAPDGQVLATAGSDGWVRLHGIDGGSW